MDAPGTVLLGLLRAAGPLLFGLGVTACASWPDSPPLLPSLVPAEESPRFVDSPRCDSAPDMVVLDGAAVVRAACADRVALYRRDVVRGGEPDLLGTCIVPCADADADAGAVYAYTVRCVASDDPFALGTSSPETYMTLGPSSSQAGADQNDE